MISKNDINILNDIFKFFEKISDDEKKNIFSKMKSLSLKKDLNMIANEDLYGCIVIKNGNIRAFISSDDGREITLYSLKRYDVEVINNFSCENAILNNLQFCVEENTEILLMPCEIFFNLKKKYKEFDFFIQNLVNEKLINSINVLQNIIFKPLKNRILDFLLTLNQTEITITHQEIAKYIGSSREVVSKSLKKMEEENILKTKRNKVILLQA